MGDKETGTAAGITKMRSPSYPIIGLDRAIEYAHKLYSHSKRYAASRATVAEAWRMSPTSGSFLTYSAALKQFDLMTSSGIKEQQKYILTEDAERIIVDATNSPQKRDAIHRVALAPKVYKELWERFGVDSVNGGVEDGALQNYLTLDRPGSRYTQDGACAVIKHYKNTMAFANLQEDGYIPDSAEDDPPNDDLQKGPDHPGKGTSAANSGGKTMPGEQELTRGTFAPDTGFRLFVRGENFTPEHFYNMLAQIMLNASFFGVSKVKLPPMENLIIPEVLPPENE